MALSLFPAKRRAVKAPLLKDATISDFGGGLNVVDNDVTMKSRYAKVLKNFHKNTDGSLSIRWGTQFKYDVTGVVDGSIIEMVYFTRHLVVFMDSGQIAKITEAGTITAIWNDTIAGALVGSPDGWTPGMAEGAIDTTEFKGSLIVCNGIDKPLIIDNTLAVEYLNDPSSGSNVNTPIGLYTTTVSNYCIIAGVPGFETDIYISSQGTSGVWVGDPIPNDGLVISIASWVPENSGTILGLGSFRNFLLVAFENAIVVVELGAYDSTGAIHQPNVQDNIVSHGVVSHRTMVATRNDFVMADILGWHSAIRTQFGLIDTKPLSELVNPQFIAAVPNTDVGRKKCFAVRTQTESRIMTFMPVDTGGVIGYALTSVVKDKVQEPAWNTYEGWDWTCGCSTERSRIFFAKGTKIYQYGNGVYPDENYSADMIADALEVWTSGNTYAVDDVVSKSGEYYICLVAHSANNFDDDLESNFWEVYLGTAIEFDWELPWSDVNTRARKKALKSIQADTTGSASFSLDVYVDNFYTDVETGERTPALSMDFVAGDSLGYGGGDQPYGGGRRLRDERPWGMPADFKLMKLRVHGSTTRPLSVITLTILYFIGTFRR